MYTQRKFALEQNLRQVDVNALKTRLTEIDDKLKAFSGVEVDAARMAKAQLFKLWSQEDARIVAKIQELEKDYEMCSVNIRKQLVEFPAYTSYGADLAVPSAERKSYQIEAAKCIEKWRSKFEAVKQANQEALLLLSQIQAKNLADAKKALMAGEEELLKAKDKEAKIRSDLEKKRQANKMKCPSCQAVVVVAEDGRHLEKCQDAPQGIGAMLGSTEPAKVETPSVSSEDLAAAVGQTASIISKRDRLNAIITAVEDKMKFDLGPLHPDVALTLLPLFTQHSDRAPALNAAHELYASHQGNKPEEVVEKAIDTSAKASLDKEKSALLQTQSNAEQCQRQIADLDINIQQFGQMLADSVSKGVVSTAEVRQKRSEIQSQIDQLMHLSSATDLMGQRSILEKTMQEKRALAETAEREFKAAERLLERAVEAERISLEAAVAEINVYLSQILKRLFVSSPISVALSTTKKLKSKKDAVSQRFDIRLFYNNSEYGNVRQLSGGEKDRLSLAITLAMSQKFGGSILFLDETLSSLDAELKSEAVTVLKEFSGGRTIVCISHEETEGLYDNVIRINPNLNPNA